jgi:xylan 1,4-beta-xylosidase
MKAQVPPFHGNISFNAQHSPMGAFMSFTCGHFGSPGGIGVQIGKPANQDLFIGVKQGGRFSKAPVKCLPFFRGAESKASSAFLVEQAGPAELAHKPKVVPYKANQIKRLYGWGADTWVTPDFEFTIHTPFGEIPDPAKATTAELRAALLPAITAELSIDNSNGKTPKCAFFAMNFNEPGWRPLEGDRASTTGFALRRHLGVMGEVIWSEGKTAYAEAPTLFCRWTADQGIADPIPHLLGSCPGLLFEIPPGEKRTLRLAIGCYLDGIVTTGLEAKYLYTRYFTDLTDVLGAAISLHSTDRTEKLDQRLASSNLSPDQQFLIAHSTRSYYGSTQLLEIAGKPFWNVNEGEYCMMNTLDLSIDQAFWELDHNPWVIRNLLESFSQLYSYTDDVQDQNGKVSAGGVSFCHDMGVNNNFSIKSHSSYELARLTGCFSYMTQEQLCNWVLLAACYVAKTGDLEWLQENERLIAACAQSMRARADIQTGIMVRDSSRCEGGQEITTYDSLDQSLGQARNNIYLAVKCWATWLGIEMLGASRTSPSVDFGESLAEKLSKFLVLCIQPDGALPAVMEKDNPGFASRILPAAEALVYPAYWVDCLKARGVAEEVTDIFRGWRAEPLVHILREHTGKLLSNPKKPNLFADGGIKLSSTSNNSWMSKIAIFQLVARDVLRLTDDKKIARIFRNADAAHVKWQTDGSGYWACSDQFVSGRAEGSRYYPRIITTALWLDEKPSTSRRNSERLEVFVSPDMGRPNRNRRPRRAAVGGLSV